MIEKAAPKGISPSQAVEHALALLPQKPALAERQAQEILKVLPQDMRALFIVGAARRRAGDAQAARAMLEPLAKAQPNSAFVHHELGLALASLGESAPALAALRHATTLARDLPDPWISLSDQLALAGDAKGASAAYAEHVRAALKNPDLLAAAEALQAGKPRDAEPALRRALAENPADVAALRMLAETASRLGHYDDAEEMLARCVAAAPDFAGARHTYALVLYEQNKAADAIGHLEYLLAAAPGEAKYLALLAACHAFVGEYERAIEILQRVLAEHPGQPNLWVTYGQALRITGRRGQAVAAFRRALSVKPSLGEAWWSLADLKTEPLSQTDIAAMRAALADPALGDDDRFHIHYALGRALEDAQSWEESFAQYAQGAKLRRAQAPFDADANTAQMEVARALFTAPFFRERAEGGCADPAPIFIVGLPRSGSTLVEQILASHSRVEATMELADLIHISARLGRAGRAGRGPDYATVVTGLGPAERTALGEEYIARTRRYRRLGLPYFIDKMPSNFAFIGIIRLILPNAKIIDVRRQPMAACFAVFKQLFFRGQMFSYDQQDVARYYRDYLALMAHFDEAAPGCIHRVVYEDLVEDTEAEIRRLLAFCGLAFEADCLRFWESDRAVPTHSSEQVRQPIFRSGLDRWRHYQPWLGPMQNALATALDNWRD